MAPDLREARRLHREQGRKLRDAEKRAGLDPYQLHKEYVAEKRREKTRTGQDIGDIPPIADPIRRRDCLADFKLFCDTYGRLAFYLPWADTHKKSAEKIQQAADQGGWHAYGEPRGSGKTTRAKWGGLWSILRGTHLYLPLIGATQEHGEKLLKGIKTELLRNDLLLADFPHVCYPIRELDGEARKASGQRYKGESTNSEWGSTRIVLPWIPNDDNPSSGGVIESFGLESAIRGLHHTRPDGSVIRPSYAIADDPQTRASAKSPSQTQTRLEILTGDVAYLAGPDKPMSIVCPCTVVYENDLADQILDREKHPEWHGERTKMVETFPTNIKLWDDYADILRGSWKEDGHGESATEFYRANREAMDEGAQVYWPERHRKNELSALQSAMNLKFRNEAAFYAECQNEPIIAQDDLELLSADEICAKTTNYARGEVPSECSVVTAFADVQIEHLFWMVCAWTPDFTGYMLDYGAWPEQKRNYFSRRDIRKKLSHVYTGDESGIMFAALTELGQKLAGTKYIKQDGGELSLGRWCIDGNWRSREQAVRAYAKQSEFRSVISLTYGRGVKASQNPFSEAQRAIKWRTGPGWFWSDGPGPAKGVVFDANLWKKRVHNGLLLSTGSRGSIQLFKAPAQSHRMLADHLLAEKPIKTEANGRTVYEWQDIPGRDNEGLDCLVGCAVGASICGITPHTERVHQKRTIIKTPAQYIAEAGGRR